MIHAIVISVTAEEVLYGYGPLGVGVAVLGLLCWKFISILLEDRNKATTDRDAMTQDLLGKVFPAVVKNTEVLEARQELDRELIEAIKETNRLRIETRRYFEESRDAFRDLTRAIDGLSRDRSS